MKKITIDHYKAFNNTFGHYTILLPTKLAKEILTNKVCSIKSGKSIYPICEVSFTNYLGDAGSEIQTYIGIEEINTIKGDEDRCICHYFIPALKTLSMLLYNGGTRPEITPWSIERMSLAADTDVEFYPNNDYPYYPDCDLSISFKLDVERLTCIEPFDYSINQSKRYFRHELTALRFAEVDGYGARSVIRLKNNEGKIEYYAYLTSHTNGVTDRVMNRRTYLFKKVEKADVFTNKAIDFFSKPYELSSRAEYERYEY